MTPDKKARLYFMSAVIGGVASLGLAAAQAFDWPDFVNGFCIGLMLVSLVMILRRKLRDEYIQQLWQVGTSTAFGAVVVLAIFGPVVTGFATGLVDGFTGQAHSPNNFDLSADYVGIGAIIAFYAGFHVAWLRSTR